MRHPSHLILLIAALAACQQDGDLSDVSPLAAAALPPSPPAATLTVQNKLLVGGTSQFIEVYGAAPGTLVYLLGTSSVSVPGPTCFTQPAICTNLNGPGTKIRAAGSATADASKASRAVSVLLSTPP